MNRETRGGGPPRGRSSSRHAAGPGHPLAPASRVSRWSEPGAASWGAQRAGVAPLPSAAELLAESATDAKFAPPPCHRGPASRKCPGRYSYQAARVTHFPELPRGGYSSRPVTGGKTCSRVSPTAKTGLARSPRASSASASRPEFP